MEKMGMTMGLVQAHFWSGKRVLVTGHTGFKGSWLSLWLASMGAEVHGLALAPPTEPALFNVARVKAQMASRMGDIRNYGAVVSAVRESRPEIIIHMAAQPLVRQSYLEPLETYTTNVMGTVHLLEAARQVGTAKAIVNVTTDKCYENQEWPWGYREVDPLGGHDPYSSSKGCAELVTSAYRRSFFTHAGIAIASARAGNVIGGGDWATDRLVPDVLRALEASRPAVIRNPAATRPWQHVLEPLSGYLVLAQGLFTHGEAFAEAWNFGPADTDARTVQWIVQRLTQAWGPGAAWHVDAAGGQPHEAHHLKLDISKARHRLGWHPRWPLQEALQRVVDWHRHWLDGSDMQSVCMSQIVEYVALGAHSEHTPPTP